MKVINKKDFFESPRKIIKLNAGGLWEENEIKIEYDVPIYEAGKLKCPHLGEKYIVRDYRLNDSYFDTIYANCPRVIVAINEGGYNSTGVCLDCILDNIGNEQ